MERLPTVAVIGGGISGISAAHCLQDNFQVTIFESANYLGGHTNTIEVSEPNRTLAVDTGFIVLNDCNYGMLQHLFEKWKVPIRWSDMSFSFYDKTRDFYYAGTDIFGLFAKTTNIFSVEFYKFLFEIKRFGSLASDSLNSVQKIDVSYTLGDFLKENNFTSSFINDFLLPMGSAIWSVPLPQILDFPARSFFQFFKNHGLLNIKDRPRWQTVVGGSRSYVQSFLSQFKGKVLLNSKVVSVSRSNGSVKLNFENASNQEFDYVVFATHADQTLKMLESPTALEEQLLSSWTYQNNIAILHTDSSILPPKKAAWASWNYYSSDKENGQNKALVTYYMNKLQGIDSATDYFVSLNSENLIDPSKIIKKINYAHPVYTIDAISSQDKFMEMQGKQRSFFCGSYFGHGFHEDGARSGMIAGLMINDFVT